MSIIRKIIIGISLDYTSLGLSILINFLGIPLYLRYITIEEFGTWLSILPTVSILTSVDFSTDHYLLTRLSAFPEERVKNYLIASNLKLKFLTIIVLAFGYLIIEKFWISDQYLSSETSLELIQITARLSILGILVSLLVGTFTHILLAKKEFINVNFISVITIVSNFFFTLLFLHFDFGIVSFGSALLVSNSLTLIIYLTKYGHLINVRLKDHEIVAGESKRMISFTFFNQINKAVYTFKTQFLLILIKYYTNSLTLASFSISTRLPALQPIVFSKIAAPLYPFISNDIDKGNFRKLQEMTKSLTLVCLRYSILTLILLFFITPPFVKIWVPNVDFISNQSFLYYLLMISALSSVSILGSIITAANEVRSMSIFSILEIMFILSATLYTEPTSLSEILIIVLIGTLIGVIYQIWKSTKAIKLKPSLNKKAFLYFTEFIIVPSSLSLLCCLYINFFVNPENQYAIIVLYAICGSFMNLFPYQLIKLLVKKKKIASIDLINENTFNIWGKLKF